MGNLVFQATLGGQVNLVGPNTASTFNLNVPAVAGNLITSGDSATVTNTMLAGSIANAKLSNSSVTVGSTSIALGATSTTLDGVNIGATTAGTGAFTTLSASSTVSGTGFSTYLASPPAIGGTAAAAGTFTTLTGSTSVTTPIVKSASSLTLQTNGTTTAITVDTSQNVGIGTASPVASTKLTINGSNDQIYLRTADTNAVVMSIGNAAGNSVYFQSKATGTGTALPFAWYMGGTQSMTLDTSGNLLIGYTSSNGSYKLQVNSQIFATSSTIATSDARYKENVEELSGALDIVKSLRPVSFDWKVHPIHNFDTKTKTVGFLAQDVQQALAGKPYLNSIIKTNECVIEPEVKDENGTVTKEAVTEEFLGIAEGNMISILTAAIKEQQALITAQAETINALTARVVALEAK